MTKYSNNNNIEELAAHWTQVQPTVAAFISSMIPSFHDAEDILQLVATVVTKKFDEYDRNNAFAAWAIGIAKLEILNYRRKSAHDKHIFSDMMINRISVLYQDSVPKLSRRHNALQRCIKQIQGRSRRALDLRYRRDYTPAQIAGQLGMTVNAIYVMLHRTRMILRKCIDCEIEVRGVS